jgi:hypothetical protein
MTLYILQQRNNNEKMKRINKKSSTKRTNKNAPTKRQQLGIYRDKMGRCVGAYSYWNKQMYCIAVLKFSKQRMRFCIYWKKAMKTHQQKCIVDEATTTWYILEPPIGVRIGIYWNQRV